VITFIFAVLAAPPAGAAPARAPLPPRAAVFVVGEDPSHAAAAGAVEVRLSDALEDAKVDLVDVDALFPAPPPDEGGKALLQEARAAFDDLDFALGIQKAEAALEAFTAKPGSADAAALADVHFFIGAVSMQLQGKAAAKKAQESFARALVFNPSLTLDEQVYGKDARKAFEKAQQAASSRASGPLTVTSTPGGAEVLVDAKAVGLTPLGQPLTAPVGRHLVTLSRAGYAPSGAFADVTPGGASVDVTLPPLEGYAAAVQAATQLTQGGFSSGKVPAAARQLADMMKSRFLVLAVKRGDRTPLEVWDVETGNRLTDLSAADEALASTAARVKDFMARPAPAAPPPALAKEAPGVRAPIYKTWWFWTAVGVVAVGGATAAGVAASSNARSGYNVVLDLP
jgi:hypothetical protein